MLKTTPTVQYKGSRKFLSSISSLFSEPGGIYIGLVGMNFVFDKSHIAHKGVHDHVNPKVFMNVQSG
jgi:hypothetical protein